MKNINEYIEHTILKPTLSELDIVSLTKEAKQHQFVGVCVPPFWVKRAKRELVGSRIELVTVIGFPLGYQITASKVVEAEIALENGATELDLVMNLSALRTNPNWVKAEVAKISQLSHQSEACLKVILETAYLSDEELILACNLCKDAGADFVKTSTGFAPSGAKVEHIKLMRETVGEEVGIKASGGIRSLSQAVALIEAGADRLGMSSSVKVVQEAYEQM